MQFRTTLFFALTITLLAAPVLSNNNGCPPKQFCSRCPRSDNVGHQLQAEPQEAGYVHCQYQDTDCYYGPKSQFITLAMGFPAGACPNQLGPSTCSDPLPAPKPKLLDTICPDFNLNFIHVPLRSEPQNSGFTQCHYASSECYYDKGTGKLATPPSIPPGNPPTTPFGVCPPEVVAKHLQYGI